MAEFLYLNSRDEFLRIDVSTIVFFEGEGNYTRIVLANGFEGLVCMNLGKMERMLSAKLKEKAQRFARIGKRHIVNLNYILQVTPLKQTLILSDQRNFQYSLNVSKEALKNLKDLIINSTTNKANS